MIVINLLSSLLVFVSAGPATVSYKDQYCTDPRTMQKHEAYTEWADAYSCTRHRCQPGGRNLAIYTVGCKRVEAPESAIECEEVVEDTNMLFPYCCTRLRCLVVVRGEVWTRVLGQPWETLPAAPWSHMYKMKKPPPTDGTFLTKTPSQDLIYELAETDSGFGRYKVLRPGKKTTTEATDCNEVAPRAAPAPAPDIVIALSTSDGNDHENRHNIRHTKRSRKPSPETDVEEDLPEQHSEPEIDEVPNTDKEQHERVSWTEIPQNQLNEHELSTDVYEPSDTNNYHQPDFPSHDTERKEDKPANLQALVDAIGTRMRDIENVVQKMSEKVHQVKLGEPDFENFERSSPSETEILEKHHKSEAKEHNKEGHGKAKKPNPDDDHYKRFLVRNRGSKYVRIATDGTTEQPIFIEDTNLSGYFSDSSNSVLRRSNSPKEPLATYMAPVENRRKASDHIASDDFIEAEKKHKKHVHKKKRSKGKCHKKRRGKEKKKKKINRVNSMELERNVVSLEDSSAVVSK